MYSLFLTGEPGKLDILFPLDRILLQSFSYPVLIRKGAMTIMPKAFLIIFFCFILYACAPFQVETGRPFTLDQIKSIKRGSSTMGDIIQNFGQPSMTGKDDNGNDIWSYIYLEAEIPFRGGPTKESFRRLTVTFERDIVKSISYELSAK